MDEATGQFLIPTRLATTNTSDSSRMRSEISSAPPPSPSKCSGPGTLAWRGARGLCSNGASQRFAISINRSLAEVRLRHDTRDRTQFGIAEFIAELAPAAALDAGARGLSLQVETGSAGLRVEADRSILAATLSNLLQNAFKFTRPGTTVTLRSQCDPRPGSSRSRGRVRRASRRARRRLVPAVPAAWCRPHRVGSWSGYQSMGRRSEQRSPLRAQRA